MKIEIRNRFTDAIIHAGEFASLAAAVADAVEKKINLSRADLSRADLSRADLSRADLSRANLSGANLSRAYLSRAYLSRADLSGANLSGAYLSGAYLSRANLSGANLSRADLSRADLSRADLSGANLSRAYLSRAYLSRADLSRANLSGANLSDAYLSDADLSGANLSGANLSGANLKQFRRDIEHVLFCNPHEAQAVVDALKAGKVNGSIYEGDCACLIGTIRNAKGCALAELEMDSSRPAETWFMQFKPDMTPDNHNGAKLTVEWIEAWIAKYGPKVKA